MKSVVFLVTLDETLNNRTIFLLKVGRKEMDAPGMFLAHLSLSRCHLRHDSRRRPRDLLRHFDAPSRGGGGGGRLLESIARRHAAKLIRIKGPRLGLGRFPKI